MLTARATIEKPIINIQPPKMHTGSTYMPLKLKSVLVNHRLSQKSWFKSVLQKNAHGMGSKPLSTAAGNMLLNWNTWPKLTSKKSIIKQTEHFLRSKGVPEGIIATVWETDADELARTNSPTKPARQSSNKKITRTPFTINLPEAEMLSNQAKNHFKIIRDPFVDDVQSADDLFLSTDQKYIAEAMYYTAKHGGFLAVVGESGAGKSTLRRGLLDRISREDSPIIVIQPRCIDKARLNTSAICDAIIQDTSREAPKRSLENKSRQIEKILTGSSRAGNNHVLIIEEAHDLTIKTLKYLKRFWELEDGYKKLLSIILVGQPELKDMLDERQNWDAREIIRRCEVAELHPLNGNLEEYLALKFNRISKNISEIFETNAFDALRERMTLTRRGSVKGESMLYPLVVNNAITKALNLAAELGFKKVDAEIIKGI